MCISEEERNERIKRSRELIRWTEEEYDSDQELKRPQPPLVKAPVSDQIIDLDRSFDQLPMEEDFLKILWKRRSNRIFTGGEMTLKQLSFLLWACQGVRGIRGKNYATLRTVASGGARHPFETYLYVKRVEGLAPGLYHYLPLNHQLELLEEKNPDNSELKTQINQSLCGQKWALQANVIFYYSIIPYRGEWRYAYDAHRVMMIDAGHVTQNLYLACTALGLGTCAIAALDSNYANPIFGVDGEEEDIFYAAPVGTICDKNEELEQEFYAFLKDAE